jgi:hypothetical protein
MRGSNGDHDSVTAQLQTVFCNTASGDFTTIEIREPQVRWLRLS